MRETAMLIVKELALFDVTFTAILFLSTVVKWYVLRDRIEGNGWQNMNPCDVMTLLIYAVPVFGPMSFLALMTTLDEGAARSRAKDGDAIAVVVGPMRYVFAEGAAGKDGRAEQE